MQSLKEKPAHRRYKYRVVSPSTKKKAVESYEFIAGPKTSGGVIDRCLKLYVDPKCGSKCYLCLYYMDFLLVLGDMRKIKMI